MAFGKKRSEEVPNKASNEGFVVPKKPVNGNFPANRQNSITPVNTQSTPSGIDAEALADMQAYSNLREKRKKAKRKKMIVGIVTGAVCLVVLVGGGLWFANSLAAGPVEDVPMQTAFVEKGTFSDAVAASGKLKPVSSVSATPEVDGLVGEVFVSEGDSVVVGQQLYTIVNADLDKAVTQAQQAINEAGNAVEVAQLAVNDAYNAKSAGIAAASVVPEEGGAPVTFDVAQADSAIRQAELSLSSAYFTLSDAQAAYDSAVATANKRTVVSTIDGSVVSVSIEPGSAIGGTGGATTAPVQIANLSQMLISVEVNEIDILKVAVDQTANVTFSAIPELELQGKVSHIATVNTGGSSEMGGAGTVTYTVSILIEAPDPRLKPGMTGKASIESERLDNVLMVPLSAMMMISDTEGSVMVVDPDNPEEFEERSVKILASDGLMVAVEGNLKEFDEILMVGGGAMMDGAGMDDGMVVTDTATAVSVG